MRYGKYGVSLNIIAALCYILAIKDQYVGMILILAYAIIIEKDSWLTKNVILALTFIIGEVLIIECADILMYYFDFKIINRLFNDLVKPFPIILHIFYLLFIIFALRGDEVNSKSIDKYIKNKEV